MTKRNSEITAALLEAECGIEAGYGWIAERLGADGDPGTAHGHYYRLPWALSLVGRRAQAASVLSWIEQNALTDDGDLLAGPPRQAFQERWSSYPLAIIATGAWLLERYGLAKKITKRLHAFQDPGTGGALAGHPDHRKDLRQDLFPTAQLGMTGLTTGDRRLADRAFNWFSLLYDAQPDLPRKLYTATTGAQLLRPPPDDEDLEWQVLTDFTKRRRAFYNPGIAAAFLGRYYMLTDDADALRLARDFLALTAGGSSVQFDYKDSVQVCKYGWGCAVLLDATGLDTYLAESIRMVHWFRSAQNDDGSWDNSPFLMARADSPDSVRMEVTAEFVQHLATLAASIGGRRV